MPQKDSSSDASRTGAPPSSRRVLQTIYRSVWVVSLAAIVTMIFVFQKRDLTLTKVDRWSTFSDPSSGMSLDYPSNWAVRKSGISGVGSVVSFVYSKQIQMKVAMDEALGALLNVENSPSQSNPNIPQVPGIPGLSSNDLQGKRVPVPERMHQYAGRRLTQLGSDLQEGATTMTQIDGKQTALSDFTYRLRTSIGKVKFWGQRATVVGVRRVYVCEIIGPESQRGILESVFGRTLLSAMFQEGAQ